MVNLYRYNRHIAALFLVIFASSIVLEPKALALTSGPAQPEMSGFQPIGVNDLVDLFTGNFRYNIPLIEVGGYPFNLTYASGQSMDDEASWVGYGWSLTPPVINRELRGIPDDYDGSSNANGDFIEKQIAMKPSITRGISTDIKLKLRGKPIKVLDNIKVGLSYSNLTGINAEVGFNATMASSSLNTSSQALNLGVTSNNQTGGTLNGKINFAMEAKNSHDREYAVGSSLGFGYNATRGLEGVTLGNSFSTLKLKKTRNTSSFKNSGSTYISFAGESYIPGIEVPMKYNNYSFTLRGGTYFVLPSFASGITGFYSKQQVDPAARRKDYPAFGLINAYKGRNVKNALMDYYKANDRPYTRSAPYLPVPVINQDLFNVSNQTGSGQYKVSPSSSGIMFGTAMRSKDKTLGLGLEVDAGYIVEAAIDFTYTDVTSTSHKWTNRNNYKSMGDFISTSVTNAGIPESYFKKVGELGAGNTQFRSRILDKGAASVQLDNSALAKAFGKGATLGKINGKDGVVSSDSLIKNTKENLGDVFSYLKAAEARKYGLDTAIPSFPANSIVLKGCNDTLVTKMPRISKAAGKKDHHISEITILDKSGVRNVYGVPVYNLRQDEVSFSVVANENARKKGLVQFATLQDSVPTGDGDARFSTKDYRFSFNKQRLRGYANSFLLTGILSPDYVDVTGNGISDDDKGNAVKFNYTKTGDYKWRTPFIDDSINLPRMANYNEGFLSDKKDDKASYVYGEKEQWYLHSVESKTMLAIFMLEDRDDALGVSGTNGDLNTAMRLKRLKEIRLYSKSELYNNKNNLSAAVPIKTVHFEYSYDLFAGVPNSLTRSKLTLKRVYFTFGANNQGKLQPYVFDYNIPAYQQYAFRQYDRWGTYKPADTCNRSGLNNSEFPYSTQDEEMADRWAGYWQLSKIALPSGGVINVNYESDDYAYVQNKRSQSMCFIKGVGGVTDSTNIINANTVYIALPKPVSDVQDLKERYFQNMNYLYFKAFVDMNNKGQSFEYIPGYAKIEKIELHDNTTAKVTVSKQSGVNPISKAAWDIMRTSLPRLAYPEYDNLDSDESNMVKAIKSMIGAIGRITDIVRSFDARAKGKNFASKIIPSKSWVRLAHPDFKKKGGGTRVKAVTMSDRWNEMTGEVNTKTAVYGQEYDYTTQYTLQNGEKITISSGVASYEPQLGNDENPFKTPVLFTESRILGINEHYRIELPLCEAYFPAPEVGYSKVSVQNIGADNSVGATGSVVSEFFTAKDFPTRVEATPLQRQHPVFSKILRLFSINITDHATVSQGYAVENFNMHGKQKAETILDKNGQEITAVSYEYKTMDKRAVNKQLDNTVAVVSPSGSVSTMEMGVDYDFYTDMNEYQTLSIGVRGEPVLGFYWAGIFPRVWFNPGRITPNFDKKLFRSSIAIKAINHFPILEKVIKTEKGSRIETENVLWDAVTGEVLMTKSQNDYDDPVYSFSYPAHWAYPGMGLASKNQGLYLSSFTTGSDGKITNPSYANLLFPGDELVNVNAFIPKKYWIIKGTDEELRMVDENGIIASVSSITLKLLRSGRRNMATTGIGTVVSLNSPIVNGSISLSAASEILDSKAVEFNEEWSMPISLRCGSGCGPGLLKSPDGFCYTSRNAANSCTTYQLCRTSNSAYSSLGARIYTTKSFSTNGSGTNFLNTSWKGRMDSCAVWVCSGSPSSDTWIGFSKRVDIKESKQYYVGIAGDNYVQMKVDGQVRLRFGDIAPNGEGISANFKYWHVYPIDLDRGVHYIEVSGRNATDDQGPVAGFGFEIYDNEYSDLIGSNPNALLDTLFSSRSMANKNSQVAESFSGSGCSTCAAAQTYVDGWCYSGYIPSDPDFDVFNPYQAGILGNWRPFHEQVFDVTRVNLKLDTLQASSTDIGHSGYYKNYTPFWVYNAGKWKTNTGSALFPQWRWRSEVTQYNTKGMETENRDALGRYSSAQMGYQQSMPVAVAANAPLRNIAYDGFEDYSFDLQCGIDTCNAYKGHFNFSSKLNGSSIKIDNTEAHTGKSSLKLTTSVTINRPVYDDTSSLYTRDASHQFRLNSNFPMFGFNPSGPGKYLLSFWMKDASPLSATPGCSLSINGSSVNLSSMKVPVIEGWKRVEVEFNQSAVTPFSLTLSPTSGTLYVDDIRIQPFDAQLKSFAYDASTLRLMAELDENNFATFYEYDDEGTLIRVKKETEKGIMTIKESRTGIQKAL